MKHSHKKSFDWYSMQQRYSIRKYYFGAASVLLGTALVLGVAASVQTVQAEENKQETTNSISVGRGEAATKPAEVSASNKEKTYAAPTVANPVETTPVKTEEVTKPAEKVEEAKDKKEEVTHQDAVDKSKLLTALSRAKKLESKLYTEASAANLQTSIQAGQSLLGKADATEAELSAAESSIQSFIIGLELRSNSNKETVSETPVAKKADAVESKEGAKPAATTERSAVDSAILPTSTADKVETTSAPASINEILKLGLSLSDARQNPAIRKEDVNRGYSGFRAASNPANPIVSGSGNTVAFADISQGGRSYSFRGYGNSRGGNSIHYDVTTVRSGNSVNFTISYSAPGDSREFVNNNFILDKGDGFGNPSNATITSSNPRVREQSKSISQGANYVSHSGYSMTSAISTNTEQTIRFSLPIINLNGDLSVRLKPVTFNVDQGGGGAATSNDPYSNSNYYYRANPLYLDANPYGGTNNKTVSEDIDFQTVYLPTSKLPEGQTRLVREGEKGQRQITYKVHRFGNETVLGLPISNRVTKEAKPRIMQIGVAKELIDTVKPRVDQNKVGDTNNLTFYLDNDGNGVYTEGVDELVQKIAIKDGAKGEKGAQGERGLTGAKGEKGAQGQAGRDGVTPTVTVKDNKNDGTHTITINDGRGNVTSTVVRDGFDGASPLVATQRNDADKTTTVIFYYDKNGNNELDASDKKLKEVVIADGAKGEKGDKGEQGLQGRDGEQGPKGEDGKTPTVKVTDGQDGTHTITINDGKGGITTTVVRDGFDGASPLVSTHRNEADKTTTVIFYYDLNDNNQFDEGDTKLKEVVIADGAKGEKGDKGDNGKDGFTPEVTVTDNNNGTHTITITQPDNRPSLTTIVKNGEDGKTPKVKAERDDAKKQTTLTFYIDKDGDGSYTAGKDELVQTTVVKDGQDGAAGASGRDGKEVLNGKVDPTTEGKYGDTFVNTQTGDVFVKKGNTWEPAGNIKGPKGDKGADGAKGEKGDQGERGLTGSKGEKGDQGERGLTGAQGAKGDKGEQGLQGRDGAQGPKGADGQRGPAGPQGPKGEQGNPGTPGKDGKSLIAVKNGTETKVYVEDPARPGQPLNPNQPLATITDGRNGTNGQSPTITATRSVQNGKNGVLVTITPVGGRPQTTFVEDGQKGADGKTPTVTITEGQNGTHTLTVHNPGSPDVTTTIRDGATGQAGRDGKDVLNGKVNPQPNQGKNGDKYINTETGDVYVKNNGNWDKEGNIKGPKGDKGADGAKGEKGDRGERGLTGAQGAKGEKGDQGERGLTGAQGEKGDRGERGLTGAKGEKGDQGERGITGAKGEKGAQGERGLTGAKGEKGDQGERGLTGAQGEKGARGERGLTGAKGEKGAQGQAGRDGVTPTVTVKDNKNDGTHTITINDGRGNVTSTVVRDGFDGASPLVATQRNDADKTTTVIFYYDKNGNNELDASDKKLKEVVIADGAKGEKGDKGEQGLQGRDGEQGPKGEDGKTPTVKVTDGQDGTHTITINDGKGGITTTVVRDGFDGASPLVSTHRNEADKTTTVIFYYDLNDNNQFDEGDTKLKEVVIADGAKGEKGDKGDNGKDGFTPEVTVTDNNNGTHTITITQPDNRPSLTTIVKNGEDGKTPKVKAERDDAKKQTTLTFYIDKDGDGSYTAGKDELVQTTVVKDGQDGAAGASGRDGKEVLNGKVDPTTEGKYGDTFVNTQTGDVFVKKGNTWEPAGNIKGPKGDKGADGAKGEKGDQGERGLTGSKGEKGDQGERGLTGAQGAKGDKGEQGLQGRDGAQGPKGADGQRGPAGPQGPKGEQGNPGTPGKDGKSLIAVKNGTETKVYVEDPARPGQPLNPNQPLATITDGRNGTNGQSPTITATRSVQNGKNGVLVTITPVGGRPQTTFVEDGQKGADGKTPTVTITEGQNGTHTLTVHNPGSPDVTTTIRDGATGQAGRDGKDVLNGKVNPQPNQGKNGDKYINTETGDVYVKNNGNWDKEGNIKGPKGDKGADGAKGEKGDQGERGLTGAQGAKGADGAVGRDGRDGVDGRTPTASVRDNGDGSHTIVITNPEGVTTETTVRDGKSPTAKVVDNGDGTHTITVVNSDGTTTTTTVRDGREPKLEVIDNNDGSHTIKVTGADGKGTTTTIFDGKSPKANIVDNGDGTHTLTIVDSDGREYKSIIKDGKDGKDSVSPTVTVKNNNDGTHVVTITNPDGSKTEMVIKDGKDGKSPKVSVEDNGDGSHTITIINSDGTVTKTVIKDGKDGRDGRDGRDGKDGKDGKCGCQDKPVTPSNDKPVPPTPNVPTPEVPVKPVPAQPTPNVPTPEVPVKPVPAQPTPNVPTPEVPVQPTPAVPTPEVPVKPVPAVPEQPVVPTPAQPATPVNANPVAPTTGKENRGDKLPETGSQSDYISVLLGSGILLSLYVGRRKED
ncbi:G5 domain-containing protein [Streptococcus pneumoniae]